ncbi:TonB-dependent receptor plug domain-containing protein [Desulfogranum japonicum]|uniref:TonB-dependent receptor plug domain-containing protein n=1 Tax=Desulfogranum japonicum TaxID=231447 RepID=UPI000427CDCD|nr:TonB-dependent receptor [Desulfogranum japonicum]
MVGTCLIPKKRSALLLPLLFTAIPAIAQEEPTQLSTMTVTGERFPVEEKATPRFITVLSSEELQETGANNLIDALRRSGGLAYKSYAPLGISQGGMNSTVSIRGIKKGELILLNGVPLQGNAGHAYDLNSIPIDQIERVEILKGAASTLYGSNAMSGVINIITKKTKDETTATGTLEFGNEGYHNHSASATIPGLTVGFNYQRLDRQEDISYNFSGGYRYTLDTTDKYAWNVNKEMFGNLFFDYLGSYETTSFEKYYDDATKGYSATDQDYLKNFADIRYETELIRVKAFCMFNEMERDEYTAPDEPVDENKNYNYGIEGDYKFQLYDWDFNVGADWIYRGADYNNTYGEHHRNDYAAFMQVKKTVFDVLTTTFGVRQQFVDGESGTADYDRFLPSLGITLKTTESLNLFANAGKAFRAPTFNNLYYESSSVVGNPDLGPEEGWTYEVGVKYDVDLLRMRLAAFHMDYEDKIETDSSVDPRTYYNATDYSSTGIEWDIALYPFTAKNDWMQDLSFKVAGYLADPVADDVDGEEYQSGPKFQTTIGAGYYTEPLVIDFNCQLLTSRERNLDDTTVLNLYAKYKLGIGYLSLSVDNIFDEEVMTYGNMEEDASSQYYYRDVGRLVKLGYSVTF